MDEKITRAIGIVSGAGKSRPFDETEYLEACTYLAENRDKLPHKVFIGLPGGLSGNDDPRWARVKSLTKELCGCGNERVILPLNQRTAYERSSAPTVTVSAAKKAYVKPVGGDKASTYLMLEIVDSSKGPAFAFMADPFGPLILTPDFFAPKGYVLADIAKAIAGQEHPAVMFSGSEKIPLFAIESVDAEAGTMTIALDRGVEAFDPDTWQDAHDHGA